MQAMTCWDSPDDTPEAACGAAIIHWINSSTFAVVKNSYY